MIALRFVNVAYKYHIADDQGKVVEGHTAPRKILQYWDEVCGQYLDVPYLENVILKR